MSSSARTALIIVALVVLAVVGAFAFGLVDIDRTREAALPEVKTEGGQLPAFDVDTADVNVGTTTETVEVPKVKVGTTEEKVELPTVDVEKADKAGSGEDRKSTRLNSSH